MSYGRQGSGRSDEEWCADCRQGGGEVSAVAGEACVSERVKESLFRLDSIGFTPFDLI